MNKRGPQKSKTTGQRWKHLMHASDGLPLVAEIFRETKPEEAWQQRCSRVLSAAFVTAHIAEIGTQWTLWYAIEFRANMTESGINKIMWLFMSLPNYLYLPSYLCRSHKMNFSDGSDNIFGWWSEPAPRTIPLKSCLTTYVPKKLIVFLRSFSQKRLKLPFRSF